MSQTDGLSYGNQLRVRVPAMSDLPNRSRQMACPRCQAMMKEVVSIAPLGHESGLVAYECPACRYLTSVLWQPNEPGAPEGFA
jgi:hypothetical protein